MAPYNIIAVSWTCTTTVLSLYTLQYRLLYPFLVCVLALYHYVVGIASYQLSIPLSEVLRQIPPSWYWLTDTSRHWLSLSGASVGRLCRPHSMAEDTLHWHHQGHSVWRKVSCVSEYIITASSPVSPVFSTLMRKVGKLKRSERLGTKSCLEHILLIVHVYMECVAHTTSTWW